MKIALIIILSISAFTLLIAWKNYYHPMRVAKRKMKYWDKARKQVSNKYKNAIR